MRRGYWGLGLLLIAAILLWRAWPLPMKTSSTAAQQADAQPDAPFDYAQAFDPSVQALEAPYTGDDDGYGYRDAGASLEPVPLAALAGADAAQVADLLGEPTRCIVALASKQCEYARRIEVVFIDQRADWLTVNLPYAQAALDAALLSLFGLPTTVPPLHQDAQQWLWRDLAGYKQVQIVGDDSGARFVRIKVRHD